MRPRATIIVLLVALLTIGTSSIGWAAGTLTPKGASDQPIQIRDHHVNIVINNGFAMTEVYQTFYNPNARDLEAIYSFPIPKSASLSEVTIYAGEKEINGEVLEKKQARQAYEEERDKGNDAGLAEKNGFQTFDFFVSPVKAQDETRIRFLYYQPLEIDTGIGRYLYPLEDGGTDDAGASFWFTNTKVENSMSVNLILKSAYPVTDVRVPGFEQAAVITKVDEGHYAVDLQLKDARLERDFLFYYRLQDDLPGRIEVIPYRADKGEPGTFMMVVTPGIDLKPLSHGQDYLFVLDVSGSMQTKLPMLTKGVVRALEGMSAEDRIRIVTFSSNASELTRGWVPATKDNVARLAKDVQGLQANHSTNLYAGLQLALDNLDDDRATSLVVVTDGVTNTGTLDPKSFHQLMQKYDVRAYGFLMGNSANWPLMRTITEASGGFFSPVSNADDIIGQLALAKSKIKFESLHNAEVKISGVTVLDVTDEVFKRVYRGQQLVVFGRYKDSGEARVKLNASLTGEDKTYATRFSFPEIDTANPEIERLWALARIEKLEALAAIGAMDATESEHAVRDLGLAYQLVTDQTSMVVLTDEVFKERGIQRKNKERVAREQQARTTRAQQPVRNYRVDQAKPAFKRSAPSVGGGGRGGGGAIDPFTVAMALLVAALVLNSMVRRQTS